MELLQLTYFCRAAETENFSQVANEYRVPASNISQSVHRLEKELGASLFDRSANRIVLNERGRAFYKNVKAALQLLDDGKKHMCDFGELSGEIHLLIECNRRIVSDAIERFQENHHKVSFFIDHICGDNVSNYDLIITDRNISDKNMNPLPLVSEDILLAMNKNNPLATENKLKISNLKDEKFITMGKASSLYKITGQICASAGFTPDIVIQSDDPFYIRKYVEMGKGVTFFPAVSWQGMFSDQVVCKKVVNLKRTTYIYFNRQRYMSKAVESFISQLKDNK